MRATRVINLYMGIYKEILAFLIYILFTCLKSKMDVRSHSLYLIHREIREQGICKNKYNVYYRYIFVFTQQRSTLHHLAIWCLQGSGAPFIYIIYYNIHIIIYNIKYLLIIYNFQEAAFITLWKQKRKQRAAWQRCSTWAKFCAHVISALYSWLPYCLRNRSEALLFWCSIYRFSLQIINFLSKWWFVCYFFSLSL